MAENTDSAAPDSGAAQPTRKGPSKKLLGIVLGIAVVQGAGFFVVFKLCGSHPAPAHAEESHAIDTEPVHATPALAEVSLLRSFKVPNAKTGRMFIYDLDLSIVVPADQKEKLAKLVEERSGEIADRVAAIVRAAGDSVLREDDLLALRTQLAEVLAEILEDPQVIRRVLIPRLVPIPS